MTIARLYLHLVSGRSALYISRLCLQQKLITVDYNIASFDLNFSNNSILKCYCCGLMPSKLLFKFGISTITQNYDNHYYEKLCFPIKTGVGRFFKSKTYQKKILEALLHFFSPYNFINTIWTLIYYGTLLIFVVSLNYITLISSLLRTMAKHSSRLISFATLKISGPIIELYNRKNR